MKSKIWFFLISFVALSVNMAHAEIVRQKNVATYIQFNIWKNDGTLLSSAAGLDSEIDAWADGSAPDGFADCTNEATEIGSTGQYYLSLTQAEMNADYIVIQVKSSTTGAVTRSIKIRTTVGDPLLLATTDDGGAINVTSGKIDEIAALTGHTAQTGDSYARLGAPAGASVSADIAAVKSDSGAILTDTAAQDTSAELRTLLFGSDTAGATAANQTTIIGYIDTEVASILEDTGTTIPGTIATIDDFLDTEIAAILADTNELQTDWANGGRLDLLLDGASSAGDPWTTALPGSYGEGTAGYIIGSMGAATDPWSIAIPGSYGAGTAGKIIGDNLNAPVATIDTVVDAIKAKTDSLTFTVAGVVDANATYWKGSAAPAMTGDAYARLGAPAGASVSADIAAVKSDSAAILVDTAAMDTANELRTLLTGGTSALSTLTSSDNIGINWADISNPTATVALSGTTVGVVTTLTTWDKSGYALSAAGIDAIWDETQSGHSTAGSFGLYLDAKVSEAGGGTLTAADIWDYDVSEYSAAGKAGTYLKGAASAGDPWLTELPGTYTEDQAGAYLPALIKKSRGR